MISDFAKKKGKKANCSKGGDFLSPDGAGALIPPRLFYYLASVTLVLPNLIYSGTGWHDTLHIMKWVFAMTPIALMALWGGISLLIRGPKLTGFKLDLFAAAWFAMLAYITVQAFWADITSWSTYFKEWFFFASLAALYVFCFNCFTDRGYHRFILLSANVNAALNVLFAELLIRNLNGPFPFIMNVPGNYIGNTGQQEMFGLWMGMALMNGIYLHATSKPGGRGDIKGAFFYWANLFLLVVNGWGLWNSTGRGGILSLLVGAVILGATVAATRDDPKPKLKKILQAVFIVLLVLAVNIGVGRMTGESRADTLVSKTADMLRHPARVGNRIEIWKSSYCVFLAAPVKGTGIGHFKWNYLDGQRRAMLKFGPLQWQYTYWAHNEYLQWAAEFGIFGIAFLAVMGAWWLFLFGRALARKRPLSSEAVWACSMIFLIWFDAVFSRPFHRIENAVWLALAFAVANRELIPLGKQRLCARREPVCRLFGLFMAAIAAAGLLFLCSGLRGDQYMRSALRTRNRQLQAYRIHQAMRMPMSRDEAEELYANHLIAVAKVTKKSEDWKRGIDQLYRSFKIRPKAKQLLELVRLAEQTKNKELSALLMPYVRPAAAQREK